MRKILLFVMLAVATFVTAQDNKFVIRGEMSSVTLCYSNETVKEVKLECTVDGQPVVLATSQVVDGKFTFEGTAPEVLDLCNITGFDNGNIQLKSISFSWYDEILISKNCIIFKPDGPNESTLPKKISPDKV